MMKKPLGYRNRKHSGSALIYILIAIALLGLLTASLMDSSSQQTTSQNAFNLVSELNGQVNYLRSAIQECVLNYPAGDTTMGAATNKPYPINPNSSYLVSPAADVQIKNARCPGNPGNSNNHAYIFAGSSGKFVPPPAKLFSNWRYVNYPDGVFMLTLTTKTDSYLTAALNKLDDMFSECEADVIDARSGDVQILSSGNTAICPSGSLCFRVWLIANPQNIYPGDTDGDEAACP